MLTCWLGEETARAGRAILPDAGLAEFPPRAGGSRHAVSYLRRLVAGPSGTLMRGGLRGLSEDVSGDRQAVVDIFAQGRGRRSRHADRKEAKAVLSAYWRRGAGKMLAPSPAEVRRWKPISCSASERIVLKLCRARSATNRMSAGVV